jgi:tetratricopeptide (TPR) repeat protein
MPRVRLAACWFAAVGVAWSHPEIEAALHYLNPLIAAAPRDAGLLLRRGQLYAQHEDWVAAEANYLRAAELDPAFPGLLRAQGALALAQKSPRAACAHFDAALAAAPEDAEALILRSRARKSLGDRSSARSDLARAVGLVAAPRPELILELAALQDAPAAAIATLDAAIARIGPAMTLHLRALEIAESAGLTASALARIDAIAATSERRELWLKRRGDLLARVGRAGESRAAYAAALALIDALPEWLQQSHDTRQLAVEIRRSLSRISS